MSNSLIQFCQKTEINSVVFTDHRSVSAFLDFSAFKRGPPFFKLNTDLLKDIEFINYTKKQISEVKSMNNLLNPHILWEAVKIKIKSAAITFGKEKARRLKQSKNTISAKLLHEETELAKNPNNLLLQNRIFNLKSELEIIECKESEGARIRAGLKWVELGEKNNAFFLGLEKQRSRNETLFRVKNRDGLILADNDSILNHLASFYKELYKIPIANPHASVDSIFCHSDKGPRLSDNQADALEGSISEADLHKAIASMKDGSSPGLDGLPAEVYKVLWLDIKDIFLDCIKFSFQTKQLPSTQHHGIIKLLFKGKGLDKDDISNWRPISLLNADYKAVAKILSIRLLSVLDKLIDENQFAFIKGRSGGDMLRTIEDIVELEKLKGKRSIMLSIDYSKAFDTVSPSAIVKAMNTLGFKKNFLEWVKIFLQDRKSCVKNNNNISEFFKMERGVRQGCPLAPLLFLCTVELLGRSIRDDPNIRGVIIDKNRRPIKILQFADDTTFFLRDQIDFREVLSKIKQFAIFSGLHLNIQKCKAMILDKKVKQEGKMEEIQLVNQIKILGIYFSSQYQPIELEENIEPKIEQLEKVCNTWAKRNLTIIGKILILKTFGISLFIHLINSIGITPQKIKKINQIMFHFLWKKPGKEGRVTEKVKRSVLCNNLSEGGLKMINLDLFQTGFLLKWGENLINKEEKEWKTSAKKFFVSLGGISAFKSNASLNQHKGMETIKSKFWRKVLEVWINTNKDNELANKYVSPCDPIFNNSKVLYKGKVLFLPGLINRKVTLIRHITENGHIIPIQEISKRYGSYPGLVLDFNILKNAIQPLLSQLKKTQLHKGEHIFYYKNLEVGKIGRKKLMLLNKENSIPTSLNFWIRNHDIKYDKDRWLIPFKATQEIKLRVLQWKIAHRIYPSGVLLHKMGIRPSENCDHCNERETLAHLFFECPKNKQLWAEIEKYIQIRCGVGFKLNVFDALHGISKREKMFNKDFVFINYLILLGKSVISKSNFFKTNQIQVFEQEYKQRFN